VDSVRFSWVTAKVDGAEHAVTHEAQARGMDAGTGLFEALCGVVFPVASMCATPRYACSCCLTVVRAGA